MVRASLFAIALMAAAEGTAGAQEGPEGGVYTAYLAFGDSYSSGVGTSDTNNDACVTSQMAWPVRVEADIGNPTFVHAACSGAIAQDVLEQGPKAVQQGGSQISRLLPAEQLNGALITIQIGGNDLLHDESIMKCIAGELKPDGITRGPLPAACDDVASQTAHVTEVVSALGASLEKIYGALRAAAPNATIVAVGYPHVVSTTAPGCDATLTGIAMPLDVRQKLNALVDAGNAQLKVSARNAGVAAITDEIVAAFKDHELCTPEEWLVSPEQIRDWASPAELLRGGHPNDLGHQVLAEAVLTFLPSVTTRNGTVIPSEDGEVDEPDSEGGEVGEPGTEDDGDGSEEP